MSDFHVDYIESSNWAQRKGRVKFGKGHSMENDFKKSKLGSDNAPWERTSSEQSDGGSNGKPREVRSWDQIPKYLKYQPVVEHHITHPKHGYEIAFEVDGKVAYVLDERKFAKPNRRRKKKEV